MSHEIIKSIRQTPLKRPNKPLIPNCVDIVRFKPKRVPTTLKYVYKIKRNLYIKLSIFGKVTQLYDLKSKTILSNK